MAAPSLWEVLDRACNTGPILATKDFDMKIFHTATRLAKEYDLKYDPETPVSSDDGLADAAWNAGLDLFIFTQRQRIIYFSAQLSTGAVF